MKQSEVDERPKLFSKNPNKDKGSKNEDEEEEEKEEYSHKDSLVNESDDEDLNKDDSNINRSSDKTGDLRNNYDEEIYWKEINLIR